MPTKYIGYRIACSGKPSFFTKGKTAAFVLPVIDALSKKEVDTTFALIIVPTRELALQIDQALEGFAYFTGVSHLAIYGGSDGKVFTQEKHALTTGTDIIVATPGRCIDLLETN